MVELSEAKAFALSLPGTEERDHFGIPSFRANNRIFSTLWVKENRIMVKLSLIDQSVFHSFDPAIFYPVPNKWGAHGCTFVELAKVRQDMLEDAITTAWQLAMQKKKKTKGK